METALSGQTVLPGGTGEKGCIRFLLPKRTDADEIRMGIGRQDADNIEEPEGAFQQNDIMPGEIFLQIPEFCGSMEGISHRVFRMEWSIRSSCS